MILKDEDFVLMMNEISYEIDILDGKVDTIEINKILAIYVNKENLSSIDEKMLQDIKFDLIDLDVETQSLKSYFAEWSLQWLEAIISLRMSEIKMGEINNGSIVGKTHDVSNDMFKIDLLNML